MKKSSGSSSPTLSSLSQRWLRARRNLAQIWETFLRSVGLYHLLVTSRIKGRETPKILIRESPWHLFAHCAVHFLPAILSLGIIQINLEGRFIGAELQGASGQDALKLGALQIAAKVQEMLILASISTVIFHLIHTMIVFGDGLPLGLLTSGWAFSQISYFWSLEFWGGVRSKDWPRSRLPSIFLILLLVVGGVISLLAGPATAILMIPRIMGYHAGGGPLWLNGTERENWPLDLTLDYMKDYDCSDATKRLYDPKCPSAGFLPQYQHWYYKMQENYRNLLDFDLQDLSMTKKINAWARSDLLLDQWTWTTHTATAIHQDAFRALYDQYLQTLDETHPIISPYPRYLLNFAEATSFVAKTRMPVVRTAAMGGWSQELTAETFSTGSSTPIIMPFPVQDASGHIPRRESDVASNTTGWYSTGYRNQGLQGQDESPIPYSSVGVDVTPAIREYLTARGILVSDGSGNGDFRIETSKLPVVLAIPVDLQELSSDFPSEMGLILLLHQDPDPAVSAPYTVYACSVDPRWASGKSIIRFEGLLNRFEYDPNRIEAVVTNELDTPVKSNEFSEDVNGSAGERIRIRPSWFNILSPVLTDSDIAGRDVEDPGVDRSALERLVEVSFWQQAGQAVMPMREDGCDSVCVLVGFELVVSTMVADGLSRCGSQVQGNLGVYPLLLATDAVGTNKTTMRDARKFVHSGPPKKGPGYWEAPPGFSRDNTSMLIMEAVYKGYVMAAVEAFDYFCIALLLIHILVVLGYTIWVFAYSPGVINAWDTIPSLLTLAQNSEPPKDGALMDTCAGVRAFDTMGQVAVVEDSVNRVSHGNEQLRLRFRSSASSEKGVPRCPPTAEVEYGALKSRDSSSSQGGGDGR